LETATDLLRYRYAPSVDDIRWFHSIDLGDGNVTRGVKSPELLAAEIQTMRLPKRLNGKTVLDIGAWDGYFSFEAERRGAARVVALDHYVWAIDIHAYEAYLRSMQAAGATPAPAEENPDLWDLDTLPGKAGFNHACRERNSSVEAVVGDFMTTNLERLGTFDVVFFLGVLYHLKDPFLARRRLRSVTHGFAVIETACIVLPGQTADKLWMFLEADELADDPSNWWAPTTAGLVAACRAAGFSDVKVLAEPPEHAAPAPGYRHHYGRITLHAYV
jgi:tRNA (mo5U34)-methyltransferase